MQPNERAPHSITRLLVANRGEIAIRIMRAAAELGIQTVAVFSEDDALSLHTRRADEAHALRGTGAAAYLEIDQILRAAEEHHCDAIHPGYGFLSENPEFARRCAGGIGAQPRSEGVGEGGATVSQSPRRGAAGQNGFPKSNNAGITFVGPDAETLATLGDKTQARELAARLDVPVLAGTGGGLTVDEARSFLASLGEGRSMLIKAVAGGGGRGMRVVTDPDEVEEAFTRCRSEALQAFGDGSLYAEERMAPARHIEVQIAGDGSGAVSHLWERECSIQRRHQKLVEIAPSLSLPSDLRDRMLADAVRMAGALRYRGLGTFEFLVEADPTGGRTRYAFIEANARLQVEHTVTEEVLDLDLVALQLQLAAGRSLAELGLEQAAIPAPRGFAIQVRVNAETFDVDGTLRPSGGRLTAFEPPSGRGIRVDTAGYAGYATNPNFDPLLAKLICHAPAGFAEAVTKSYRALCEFKIDGVQTNIPLLQNLLRHPDFAANRVHTGFAEEHLVDLVTPEAAAHHRLFFDPTSGRQRAGAEVDPWDPLAVLAYGKTGDATSTIPPPQEATSGAWDEEGAIVAEGLHPIRAPMQATIVSVDVREGEVVRQGRQLLVLNAMKMEHVIRADVAGVVIGIDIAVGDTVYQGTPLIVIEERDAGDTEDTDEEVPDLDRVRADLAAVQRIRALTLDAARPEAVARRHATGHRTARENVEDLCEPGSFVEYGQLVVGQGLRGSVEERIHYAPTDGLIMGLGRVNGDLFDERRSRCAVVAYDYTVLAGTQSGINHRKKDRIFQVAERLRVPLVLFAEGGGGRAGGGSRNAGNTRGVPSSSAAEGGEIGGGGGLSVPSWTLLGRLNALVPTVGITTGRSFAGNAALLGLCDVVIATRDANIGMGGPAMVEGGGLGVYRPEEIGPMSVQVPNGVVDVAVADEAEAVAAAKRYLSYFQGRLTAWECADQRLLRGIIPENRLRVYNVREVIETLADAGSVLELRRGFGLTMVTALIRVEGRPLGVIANNPLHLSGAIDSDAADKAARFMQLCDAFDLPILFLCDTPGIMVGPEVEKTALVRHAARMWAVGTSVTVPTFTVVLRKAYGLGGQTMGGGNHKLPIFTVSWPTGEFGGMGLEGQVKLGRRRELEAVEDPAERRALYDSLVAQAYERGKALNAAHVFEVDDVIDPADTRRLLVAGLESAPPPEPRTGKKRPCIDTW